MCVCVCSYPCFFYYYLSPPGNFAIPLPPLFLHLAAHLLHFLQLKSKLSSIRSICRLGRESATPLLSSPSHPLITSSQASHEPLWASSSLVTHTLTHTHTRAHHMPHFVVFPISNLKLLLLLLPPCHAPAFVLPLSRDNIQLNVDIAAVAKYSTNYS